MPPYSRFEEDFHDLHGHHPKGLFRETAMEVKVEARPVVGFSFWRIAAWGLLAWILVVVIVALGIFLLGMAALFVAFIQGVFEGWQGLALSSEAIARNALVDFLA